MQDRSCPAGIVHGRVRDGLGDRELQPRSLRQACQPGPYREGAEGLVPMGQEGQPDQDAFGRHETPRDDRQGPFARAANPLPRRANGGRRCGASARHVGDGAIAARHRRHHHPDHPLHRGGRGDGRPDRGDQQGRDHLGGGQGGAHDQARQEAANAAFAAQAGPHPGRPRRLSTGPVSRRKRVGLHLRRATRPDRNRRVDETAKRAWDRLQGSKDKRKLAGGDLRQSLEGNAMNVHAIRAIYLFEMARTWRTLLQSIVAPVISTSLYFIVFGAAVGSRMTAIGGISYGAFIVPGLIMLSLLTQSISNASFGIFFPKFSGTIYEILSAPVSYIEIVIGYVGAAAGKSILLGLIILVTARMFVAFEIVHPLWMLAFLILTAVTFSLFGFIIGIWADGFEQLQLVPLLIVTPLTFLGGSFYSISMLPPVWRTITLANPVVYLVSGFRWSFYGSSDVSVGVSLCMTMAFLILCLATVWWIFTTGYRLRT